MKKLVVYVNKADMVEDPEMLELVRLHNLMQFTKQANQ